MHSKLSEDYLWFLVWGDGYVKQQLMFNIQVWKCVCVLEFLLFKLLSTLRLLMEKCIGHTLCVLFISAAFALDFFLINS